MEDGWIFANGREKQEFCQSGYLITTFIVVIDYTDYHNQFTDSSTKTFIETFTDFLVCYAHVLVCTRQGILLYFRQVLQRPTRTPTIWVCHGWTRGHR